MTGKAYIQHHKPNSSILRKIAVVCLEVPPMPHIVNIIDLYCTLVAEKVKIGPWLRLTG